ncbi:MAG: TonB-dependent receptor [Prevotella sp.]|nr:TonB-dependent receptor [Prevotella sp.]
MKRWYYLLLLSVVVLSAEAQTPVDSTAVQNDSTAWERLLEGVTVTGQRQLIKQDIDRIGYDVQTDETARTENVLDVLRKVPLVTVDGEDNILVRGNASYKIYKNGHFDPSLSKNAKEILRAMPASSVKRIEVVTDPGAREDAEGVNAILNIVMMDTRRMEGVTGSVSAGYTSLEHSNLGASLTTQFGKLILSADYYYGGMSKKGTRHDASLHRKYVQTSDESDWTGSGSNPGNIQYADISASYEIDSLNLLSASFGGYFYKLDVQGGGDVRFYDAAGNALYSYTDSYWMPGYSHHSWNGRLDYEHKTRRRGEKFTLSYMLALTRQHDEQETNYMNVVNFPFDYTGYLNYKRERFTEHTFQADYLRPLAEGHQLEVGAKFIDRRNSSHNRQDFYQPPMYPSYMTEFEHTTQIAAAYADYIFNKGKWSARAGLRYEFSYLSGHYPDARGTDFDRYLNDWVPQASVKYQLTDRQSLKLGYTTSITRPGITYLNPAVSSSAEQVSFGNAHLISAREQGLSLTYLYVGQRLTLQLVPAYRHYSDALGSIVYAEGDRRYYTYGNVLRQHRYQLEGYVQWKPFGKTTIVVNTTLTDNHAENTAAALKQHTTSLFYYTYLSQRLPWKLTATAYTFGNWGRSPENIYAYARSWQRYGFTLQRSFLSDDRLTVRLSALSPFTKDGHYRTRTTQGDILGWGDNVNAQSGRQFQISASFRFGKLKASVKKAAATIENTDEVGGIIRGR